MAELLNEGFQYKVYDLGDEVKKVPKSREEMIEYSKNWGSTEEEAKKDAEKGIARREKVEEKFKGKSFEVIADFRFEGDVIFQEKVKVAGRSLEEAENIEEKKAIIDQYILLVKECWRYGFHDMSYNFTVNTGFNSEGELVQIDLGDLIFSKERIKEEVRDQKWLKESWSYKEDLEGYIKEYYRSRMEKEITVAKLNEKWLITCPSF